MYVRAAGPLTVTILSIAISNIFHLYNAPYNIRTVGTVPAVRPELQVEIDAVCLQGPCRPDSIHLKRSSAVAQVNLPC